MNAGAAAAAAAAAAAKQRADEEEERMTGYRPEDLEGWEFKILRSGTGVFKKPDRLRQALEEEALAGWEMIEKFDDNRIRLKRRSGERSMDASRDVDAYRTWYGTTPNQVALWVLLGLGLVLAAGGILAGLLAH